MLMMMMNINAATAKAERINGQHANYWRCALAAGAHHTSVLVKPLVPPSSPSSSPSPPMLLLLLLFPWHIISTCRMDECMLKPLKCLLLPLSIDNRLTEHVHCEIRPSSIELTGMTTKRRGQLKKCHESSINTEADAHTKPSLACFLPQIHTHTFRYDLSQLRVGLLSSHFSRFLVLPTDSREYLGMALQTAVCVAVVPSAPSVVMW